MENYGQGNSLKNLRKVANIFMLVMAGIVFPAIVFVGCDTGGGSDSNNTNGDEAFNEVAFRAWAAESERSFTIGSSSVQPFNDTLINNTIAFIRDDNWDRNTHRNDPATFRQLTRTFIESTTTNRPITVTKGGKTFNNNNPLGSFMLEQRRTRAV